MINTVKRFAALVLALAFALLCCVYAAQATAQLPLDIKNQFGNAEIVDSTYWDSPGSTWFVLVRTPDGVNHLVCYVLEDGTWTQKFQTAAAMPQGKNRVKIYITDKVEDFVNNRIIRGPVLAVMQYGTGEHESGIMAHYGFVRSDPETWTLFSAFFWEEQTDLDIEEDSVTFRTPVDQYHDDRKTVPLHMERDLKKIDFTEIPRTAEQAKKLLPDGQ